MVHALVDILKLSDPTAVRRDASGVPTAFRILRAGKNALTLDGKPHELDLTPELRKKILDHYALKGELVPVDAEHFLLALGEILGQEEADLLKTHPKLGEQAAHGFVKLEEEGGDLWAKVERWSDRARQILSAGCDKMVGYFSPTIRGLKDGNYRITSIALTNEAALNDLPCLVALSESMNRKPPTRTTEDGMKALIEKLGKLLSFDVAALTGESPDLKPLLGKVVEHIEKGELAETALGKFRTGLKDALTLTDADTPDTIVGKILSAVEKGRADAVALADAKGKLVTFGAEAKQRLIDELKADGKLTEAMAKDWAPGLDIAALTEWAKHAPVIVPVDRQVKPGDKPAGGDAVALTEVGKEIAVRCGMDPKHVEETVKKVGIAG